MKLWCRADIKSLAGKVGFPEKPNAFDVTLHPDSV